MDILASPPQTFPAGPPFHSLVQRVFLLFLPTGRQEGAGLRGLRLPGFPSHPSPWTSPLPSSFPRSASCGPQGPAHRWLGQKGASSPWHHPPNPPSPVLHVRPPPGSQETTTPIGSLAPNPLRHWEELVHSVLPVSLESVRLEGEVNALICGQLSVSYLEGVCPGGKDLQGSCELLHVGPAPQLPGPGPRDAPMGLRYAGRECPSYKCTTPPPSQSMLGLDMCGFGFLLKKE